jgi:hypothetical protein
MTVLTAAVTAARMLSKEAPRSLYATTLPFDKEMAVLANEAAVAMARRYDWRKLTILKTFTGDGTTEAFDLPADYDRMPVKAELYSSRLFGALTPVRDLDVWLENKIRGFKLIYGQWTMLGGQLQIMPAPAAAETISFYYLSNLLVTASGGATKALFDQDTDTFRLPERLLTLDLVWRWRRQKGLDYAEDMRNFEIAFAEESGREKGSRMLAVGRPRSRYGAATPYPGVINA